MNIILCNKNKYKYFEDYINSIIHLLNATLILFDYNINLTYSINNNYIFVQNINNNFYIENSNRENLYLINTEQLSVEQLRTEINNFSSKLIMIDYSISNLKYYDEKFIKFVLPYQINYNEINNEYKNKNKNKNVCLIGTQDNIPFNRQNIINLLKEKNINVDIISGFNKDRDNELFKYKIILNISYFSDNYKIFESLRCDRCIYNKMIVISDLKDDINDYYLYKYIIFVNYNEIVNTVINVINNYEYYYNKLFSNFDFKEIENKLTHLSQPLLDKINLNK